MLKFDDETARLLEVAYQGADFRRRRAVSFGALDPKPGETLADIGCGNGLLTIDLAHAVGREGRVWGVDPSGDMLAKAADRLAGLDQATLAQGTADSLPVEDATLDGALSLQVFEYIADTATALTEVRRALKPGGRLVLGDMHFETLAWFSENPERMRRMMDSWDLHVADPISPVSLVQALRRCGFTVENVQPHTSVDTELRPDGLARMMTILMRSYAVSNGHVLAEEADAWFEEQEQLAREGRFFHTLTHFVITARKPV